MPNRPNILLITTDQQRCDSLGCYGASWARTPAIDALADGGVRLDRAYCTNPVCTPSRVSLFTGLSMHRHGVWHVGCNAPEELPFFTHALRADGYRTASVGKLHLQAHHGSQSREGADSLGAEPVFPGPYYGMDDVELSSSHGHWHLALGQYGHWLRERIDEAALRRYVNPTPVGDEAFNARAFDWDLPADLQQGAWAAERSRVKLEQFAQKNEAFFLHVGFADPHHPHAVPRDWHDRPAPGDIPPPVGRAGELEDLPPHFKHTYEQGTADAPFAGEYGVGGQGRHRGYAGLSEEAMMTARAYYQAMVRQIDRHVGSILTRLRELDLERDTLVIFTSDHGELLGDHGLWLKGPYHFEPLIRVPLIMRWPGGLPGGEASAGITSLADIAPTVLSAAGLAAPDATDGHDLLPALNGEASWPREYALVEHCDDPDHLRPQTIVTQDDKRTVYTDRSFGEYFDLRSDPDELHNRWDDPACAGRREELQKRLDRHPPAPLNPVPRVALA